MKQALLIFAAVLASSVAMANDKADLDCQVSIIQKGAELKAQANSFISDVEETARQQQEQDGVVSLNRDVLNRVERAKAMVDNIFQLEVGQIAEDQALMNSLCESKLNVIEAIWK
jgi:hypothetical protein